ncbi:MAG: MFS transporter [Spirochaetes bacterium]|nr:MFS transporter [Spirochaetota bacterium]
MNEKRVVALPGFLGRKGGIYYGWYIVAVAFASNFLGTGTGFYIFNAFIEPLCTARGWTRAEINIAPMLGYIVNLFGVLLYGTLVTRLGPRILVAVSSVISALSFLLMGITSSLWLFYLLFMTLFLGISGMCGIVTATMVGNWFVLRRGSALGLATAGVSLSGVVMPAAALAIIRSSGMFYAFLWVSIGILFVAPLALYVVRTRPEDHGLLPDGVRHEPGAVHDAAPFLEPGMLPGVSKKPSHWTAGMVIRDRTFWTIGIAYGLSMATVLGVMFQLKPRFSDIGFDAVTAMRFMAATALVGTAGKYLWAFMCDRFPSRHIVALLLFLNAAGLSLILLDPSLPVIMLFIAVYGFAMGGVVSTQPVMIAEYFGREAYPTVARYVGLVVGINFIGYPLMGWSFDLTGSYDAAYAVFILLNLVSMALVMTLPRPPQ